jgi:hypothetical protein
MLRRKNVKTLYTLFIFCVFFGVAQAQGEPNSNGPLKKCVGVLTSDGDIIYKEDCISPSDKIVKKGIRRNVVSGAVDTPEKATKLLNNMKDESTVLVRDEISSDQ